MEGITPGQIVVPVGKNNVATITHDGNETLFVVFKNEIGYKYWPVTVERYNHLVEAAADTEGELFKADFNRLKGNPTIKYEKL